MATMNGICQVCFNTHRITGKGALYRHGWQEQGGRRVGEYGNAWHTGSCYGVGYVPFEVSCERTKWYLTQVEAEITRMEGVIENLATLPELTTKVEHKTVGAQRYSEKTTHSVTLKDGDAGAYHYDCGCKGLPTYNWASKASYSVVHKRKTSQAVAHLEGMKKTAAFLTEAIRTWKPAKVEEAKRKGPLTHYRPTDSERFKLASYAWNTMSMRPGASRPTGLCGRGSYNHTDDWSKVDCEKCRNHETAVKTHGRPE